MTRFFILFIRSRIKPLLIRCLIIAERVLRIPRFLKQKSAKSVKFKCGKVLTMMHFENLKLMACWIPAWYILFAYFYDFWDFVELYKILYFVRASNSMVRFAYARWCQLWITENSGLFRLQCYQGDITDIWQYLVLNSVSHNKTVFFSFHCVIAAIWQHCLCQ